MTISYSGNFAKLLFRWKGSIWKSVWKELAIFMLLYYAIRLLYRHSLTQPLPGDQPCCFGPNGTASPRLSYFEYVSLMFDSYIRQIPLTFLLGFYISEIVKRWWSQFEWLAWPDDLLSLLCAIMPGNDSDTRLKRHTIARYVNLTAVLAWRDVSTKVRKRFPTIQHLVMVGLMSEEELELYHSIPVFQAETVRWYLPLQWVQKLVLRHCAESPCSPPILSLFLAELNKYRLHFRKLYCYDWVCIPLVYTQVAALATYGYFGFCLLGRQFLLPEKAIEHHEVDFVVPVFTVVQFLFFVGWFKVGQDLMRPFGTDDDDIELNYILDRNTQASFTLVDSVEEQCPTPREDPFWTMLEQGQPLHGLPHTKLSAKLVEHPPKLHSFVTLRRDSDGNLTSPTGHSFTRLHSVALDVKPDNVEGKATRKLSNKRFRHF